MEIGIAGGIGVYQGDLTPSRLGSFETMRFGLNLSAARIVSNSFSIRGNILIAGLRGNDAAYNNPEFRKERAFAFQSPVTELSLQLVLNPLGKNNKVKQLSPYFFAGIGAGFLNIQRDFSRFNADYFGATSPILQGIDEDLQVKPPSVVPVIPAGVGLRYNLSERFAINAEGMYRFLFTDYVDGVSKAANPKFNDHYHTTMIGVLFRTGYKGYGGRNKTGCPPVY
jgi:hypothetical protein